MNSVSTTTYWLQMDEAPVEKDVRQLPGDCMLVEMKEPSRPFYLYLYTSVGKHYQWYNRLLMDPDELEKVLCSPATSIWVLYCKGVPAGFVEYNICEPDETEILYFGLVNEFTGRGLGLAFLQWCIAKAWERPIKRLWLHTCDMDHKAALSLYKRAGFLIYDEDTVQQEKPNPKDDPYQMLPW